jgi:nitroimidazol reductase NimA-like FMN-containing flavoprotein (pyridoxamine 5'-phosphate oxidase superfamily)
MSLVRKSSAWDQSTIDAFLRSTVIPIRLAASDSAGVPLICSLWYLYDGQALWCATQQPAAIVRFLKQQQQCGFEIAPEAMPYRGVRGQGKVTLLPEEGEAVLLQLIDRYLDKSDNDFANWLIARAATEVAIKIQPDWFTSWDFGKRMSST